MAILKIARMGHPVLLQKAAPIDDPRHPEVRRLVSDMLDTIEDAGGTGLAAPQVYVPQRLVVFYVTTERAQREDGPNGDPDDIEEEGEEAVPLTVLINPVIEPLSDEMALGWEACLSLPDLAGQVPRYTRIRYRGLTLSGEEIQREASGFHARVVQHECDHLDGLLYPQRMTNLRSLTFTSEIAARGQIEAVED